MFLCLKQCSSSNILSYKQPNLSKYSWLEYKTFKSARACVAQCLNCRHLVSSCGFICATTTSFYICQRWQNASEGFSFRLNFNVISNFCLKNTDIKCAPSCFQKDRIFHLFGFQFLLHLELMNALCIIDEPGLCRVALGNKVVTKIQNFLCSQLKGSSKKICRFLIRWCS